MERGKWLILSSVSVGTFMATLDGSIVNISLPKIADAFAIDLTTVEWVVLAYLLSVGSLLLPFGRLGEVLTFRRVYLAGFALFTLASVLCGAAPTAPTLVLFRVVQGVGAAMLQAMGPAIIARTFGPGERGRALGFNALSVSLGLTIGPALGGLLTELGSWRAIFLVNAPVGLFAILWAARVLPTETRPAGATRFDLPGATLAAATLFAVLLVLAQGQAWGWTSPVALLLVAGSVVGGVGFVVVELRSPEPMIDLRLFRNRAFSAGLAAVIVVFAGLFTATFLLPFVLEGGGGYSPLEAGLLLTPVPLCAALVAPASGAISDRVGSRGPASLGLVLMTGGLLSLTLLPIGFTIPDLAWRLVILGIGQGMFMSPNSSAVLGAIPRPRLGTASGALAQARIDGQAIGIAVSAAVVAVQLPVHLAALAGTLPPGLTGDRAFILAAHDAFLVAAVICGFGIVASLVRGRPERAPSA